MLDDGRRMENEDVGEGASDKGKQVQSESIKSSSSTSTEGSVLSQSVHHDDQEEEPARLLHAAGTAAAGEGQATSRIEQFSEHLDDSLARIDRTLEDLERSKLAFRDSLIQQIEARRLAIHKHEIYLASCSERQELMRKDRELVSLLYPKGVPYRARLAMILTQSVIFAMPCVGESNEKDGESVWTGRPND
jgi:hypothetical protein